MMPGRGPAPKAHTQRPRDEKRRARGSFHRSESIGWQHGDIPEPPPGMQPDTLDAWREWFSGWVAAHWIPGDVPQLRHMARLYDAVVLGKLTRAPELRMWMDGYGLTPKGQPARQRPLGYGPRIWSVPAGRDELKQIRRSECGQRKR